MKRYKIGNNVYWYNEGEQPANAVEVDVKKTETEKPSVEVKINVPKNKAKGVKAK